MEGTENSNAETSAEIPAVSKKNKQPKINNGTKIKLNLNAPDDHPLGDFLAEVKKRGIKNFDLNEFIIEATNKVPSEWWQEKIDSMTPLEFKINEALANPEMREKLTDLLTSEQLKTGKDVPLHS